MKEKLQKEHAPGTPLADSVGELASNIRFNFHTLPISCGASLHNTQMQERYEEIFGTKYLSAEMTVTGKHFDSFFFAERTIKEAEHLASLLYEADGTLFVTSGTTVSNQIAINALYQKGNHVLLDKGCHQSIHFMLQMINAEIAHIPANWVCEQTGKQTWCIQELLTKILCAQENGEDYQLIVLNAHSYDGVIYDIPTIIKYLLNNGVKTRNFLIDEAWGSANYCNESIKQFTAMNIGPLIQQYPDLSVVATHSAHKSLSCLRQASMIHYRGSSELAERLRLSRFRLHTTSPSYPILASLDLGRAQMQEDGEELLRRSCALAQRLRQEVMTNSSLTGFRINNPEFPSAPVPYAHADPTKISLNVADIGLSAEEAKDALYIRHGIYVNRITDHSLLFNFHIGITQQALDQLLDALRDLRSAPCQWPIAHRSHSFIIPYPPGVPLIVPGEPVTAQTQRQIRNIQRSGVLVFSA